MSNEEVVFKQANRIPNLDFRLRGKDGGFGIFITIHDKPFLYSGYSETCFADSSGLLPKIRQETEKVV